MSWLVPNLWLIPALPLLAAAVTALAKRPQRRFAATLTVGSMALAFLLSCWAFITTLGDTAGGEVERHVYNFNWLQFGDSWLQLGWVLDPLAAVMLVMVALVGLLIFIYSVGYMAQDENFTRFFCFMSLFAAAMLGLVIANSLLLLFICWELVGLSSYLLIGFWYHKPSAAAAAKKAFIVTRISDVALLLGMVWLYSKTGTLLFYDAGNGCLENQALAKAFPIADFGVWPLMGIALLLFAGAMGKSGQVPLHVWLPDAMEGPTPVSALIHAATMVAAGVFLVARVYPLMKPDWAGLAGPHALVGLPPPDAALVITWIGSITAVFAALIAVAQTDIKRILAYSTVSQLGYMMMGLGVGGIAVGMFHLITHAFFKALLFMGAGSVIHGCQEEQDIRRMGGLRALMPVTFATYAVGMMALCGVPLLFSGFWSKDEILHEAFLWKPSVWPFYLGVFGALLTAFYMTRQVCSVFFGHSRAGISPAGSVAHDVAGKSDSLDHSHPTEGQAGRLPYVTPHESPAVMTWPLIILAAFAVLLGLIGTPAWPWFQTYLSGHTVASGFDPETLFVMLLSSLVAAAGIGTGWWFYGRKPAKTAEEPDPLVEMHAGLFAVLRNKFFIDELYEATVVRLNGGFCRFCHWIDSIVLDTLVLGVSYCVLGFSWLNRVIDEYVVNLGFDAACKRMRGGGGFLSRLQDGQVQNYLRVLGLALTVLLLLLTWGCGK